MNTQDRYRGALVGLAACDALGTTLEFKRPGTFTPVTDITGGGPFHLKPGQWTDDTSMALCLAESLIEKHGFDPVDQLERYVRWYRHGHMSCTGTCFDIGGTTSAALHTFERTHEPYCGSTDPHAAGNGSIMRLAPVPLVFAGNPEEAIERSAASSRTTHGAIVDECHRAAAASYDQVLTQLKPTVLLGLTTTPERGDGQNILSLFDCRPDGGPAAELRLWQALDQQLLSPFEYYGCADDTDFSRVPWDKSDERTALDQILIGNHARALTAIAAFNTHVANPRRARALAFCVSVAHAEFMATEFMKAGITAEAVTGQTPAEKRRSAPTRLAAGEVTVLCTCDLYNEGIDIPSVDTLLFLRPTQSPVVFQQQLGRGLRLYDKKESCVVIDLVGRHREDFRFDRLLAVLTGLPRATLIEQVQHGFNALPPGCHLQLDRISRQQVLGNLKKIAVQRWSMLARELSGYAALPGRAHAGMAQFLADQGLDLPVLYPDRGTAPSGWTALRRQAGLLRGELEPFEVDIGRRLHDLLHHEDRAWLSCTQRVAEGHLAYVTASPTDQRRVNQLAAQLFPNNTDPCTGAELACRLAQSPTVSHELAQLATLLDEASDLPDAPLPGVPDDWPLCLHARYTLRELMLAIGWLKPNQRHVPPTGVLPLHQYKTEFLLVTLDKSAGFTSRTAYHDYAISPELFHWQSQNSCALTTSAGQRYLHGAAEGWTFLLFVRETKGDAYRALGPVVLVDAKGERPMSITWKLSKPLPAALFRRYSVLRDA